MEEKRFTPGPWFVQDDEWTDGDTANITSDFRSDNSIVPVAQISGGGSGSGFDSGFSLEQNANAKLIAAAPELLEALQGLLALYESDEGCRHLAEYTKARAAIAKALGKE